MCFSSSSPPPPPAPPPPVMPVKIETDVDAERRAKKQRKLGTKALQIPLFDGTGGAGLGIPTDSLGIRG